MSRLTPWILAAGVVFASITLIYYSRDIAEFLVGLFVQGPSATQTLGPTLAKLQEYDAMTGTASDRNATRDVHHLQELRVPANRTYQVQFKSGWVIELPANTVAIAELYRPQLADSPALVSLVSGDFKLVQVGTAGKLFVMRDKQIFSPQAEPKSAVRSIEINKNSNFGAEAPAVELPAEVVMKRKTISASKKGGNNLPDKIDSSEGDGSTLSNAYIEQVLGGQANSLRNCQMNSLRDNRPTQGSVLLSFTIRVDGAIERLAVLQNKLANEQLTSCVVSVIERTKFKPFEGAPVSLTYPIDFK